MTCKIDYTGNAVTVAFPFPFAIPAETALEVRVNDAVRKEGFRINCAGNADGGMVVFDSAPAAGDVVSLHYLGAVTIGVQDAAAGHLADKLVAGGGISLQTEADGDGVQRLRIGAVEPADMLKKSENLHDVPNKGQACQNLGVYTSGQTEGAIRAAVNEINAKIADLNSVIGTLNNSVATVSGSVADLAGTALRKANHLSEFSDLAAKAAARANLDIYSKEEVDAADQAMRNTVFATDAEAVAMAEAAKAISPANLASLFGGSLEATGYMKLPGGLMLQWGGYGENGLPLPASGYAPRNVSFPKPFTTCLRVIATSHFHYVLVAPVDLTPVGFTASFSSNSPTALNIGMSYIAIGRA